MKVRQWVSVAITVLLLLSPLCSTGQENKTAQPNQPGAQQKGIDINDVIQRFASNETKFKQALDRYTYTQEMTAQTLEGDRVDGEYHCTVDVGFDKRGRRREHIVSSSESTLRRVSLTKEDFENILHQPFVLTSDQISEYKIVYVGKLEENAAHFYVFDVAPKRVNGNKPYFQGRIWVDDHGFQIVKVHGKTTFDINTNGVQNLFPALTTLREQVDGEYYFPAYSQSDEFLRFSTGSVHVRQFVKYSNYRSLDKANP